MSLMCESQGITTGVSWPQVDPQDRQLSYPFSWPICRLIEEFL